MRTDKTRLAVSEAAYSISSLPILGQRRIIAAPEGPGPIVVFDLPGFAEHTLATGPGGCMGFAAYPGRDDVILAISDFYPVFRAEAAGVDTYTAVDGLALPWARRRALDLPFVHRIRTIMVDGRGFLVAAAIADTKDAPDDWSRAGSVVAVALPADAASAWEPVTVLEGIHRNHGMAVGEAGGRPCVYVSGDEGLVRLVAGSPDPRSWEATTVIDRPISEFAFVDLDADGEDEVAIIEPFHGDQLTVLKSVGGRWQPLFEAEIGFGHGLWAGRLGGERLVIVGNRAGERHLMGYRVASMDPFAMEPVVLDGGTGTTAVDVVEVDGRPAIIASNQALGEYAAYAIQADSVAR